MLTTAVTVAGLAWLSPPALATQPRDAGWTLVKVNSFPKDDLLNDVTVTRDGTVWAAGNRTLNGAERGLLQQFDGRRWKTIPGSPPYDLATVAATSARNAWVFGRGKAARWNGTSWTTRSLGTGYLPSDADAVGAKDIWVVSESTSSFRHWNGASWKRVPAPGGAKAVDAYSASQVWAAGARNQRPLIMRWNGSFWASVPLPELALPSPDAGATLHDIAVVAPNDVWAVGGVSWEGADAEGDDVTFTRTLLLRWDGTEWKATVGTANTQPYTEVEPDGRGGVWIAQSHWNSTLLHMSGGTSTSTPLPRRTGMDAALYSIARRPGTATLWGAGFTSPQGDPDDPSSNGAFWRLG